MPGFSDDMNRVAPLLRGLPKRWEGKECILRMKECDYHWRQTEWWAFYFELLCRERLASVLRMPGDRDRTTVWDGTGSINWDFKGKAIKTDTRSMILNDHEAMNASIDKHGEHGLIVCLCDVEYNDKDRTFEQWRTDLHGGKSKYQVARDLRTPISRYRKTLAVPVELLFMRLDATSKDRLGLMKQGRNSNGKDRPVKYTINIEACSDFIMHREKIGEPLH